MHQPLQLKSGRSCRAPSADFAGAPLSELQIFARNVEAQSWRRVRNLVALLRPKTRCVPEPWFVGSSYLGGLLNGRKTAEAELRTPDDVGSAICSFASVLSTCLISWHLRKQRPWVLISRPDTGSLSSMGP